MGGRIGENQWSDNAIFDGRIQRESVVAFGEITQEKQSRRKWILTNLILDKSCQTPAPLAKINLATIDKNARK
jgi:hypothetical protein